MWAYGDHSYSNYHTERGGLFGVATPGNGTNTEDQWSPTKHHLWSSDMCFSFQEQSRGGAHNSEVLLKLRPTQPTSVPSLSWFRATVSNLQSLWEYSLPLLAQRTLPPLTPHYETFERNSTSWVLCLNSLTGKGWGALPASLELLLDCMYPCCLPRVQEALALVSSMA